VRCSCCDKAALYRVGHLGYCKGHSDEALKLQAKIVGQMEVTRSELERSDYARYRKLRHYKVSRTGRYYHP
jgi:hypothetical protein